MAQARILVVDDEQHIVDVLDYVLRDAGYEVHAVLDGDEAVAAFERVAPALVVLDLNLPGSSGLDLFGAFRQRNPAVPIIMLTSRGEEIDRVVGLEMGADDYVTKPFSPRELAARVRAVLRRSAQSTTPSDGALAHGPVRMDVLGHVFEYFGTRVMLTGPEFRLLECLVRHPARVFTREMLLHTIYDDEAVVTDRSIDAYVKRVRRKLSDVRADVPVIETVHGLGYKLHQELDQHNGDRIT